MNSVRLGFYRTHKGDHWMNKLAAAWTLSDLTHVELVFSDETAFSVWSGDVAFLRPREHAEHYVFVSLPISPREEQILRRHCEAVVASGAAVFNKRRMMFGRFADALGYGGGTFCSEMITRALQVVGVFTHLIPYRTSPKVLYDEAKKIGYIGVNGYSFYRSSPATKRRAGGS